MPRRLSALLASTALLLAGCGAGAGSDGGEAVPSPSPLPPPETEAARVSPPAADPDPAPASLRRLGIREYVALGDSYTSAPGVPPIDPESGGCFRSQVNYPALVAATLDARVDDRSCSGADSTHLTAPQQTLDRPAPPQLDALTPDTDLVTVGLGGNEFNLFATLLGFCLSQRSEDPDGAPCRAAMQESGEDRLVGLTPAVRERLGGVVARVRDRSPDARVLLVGYPRLVPEAGTCSDRLPLALGDYPYVGRVSGLLNDAVRGAARRTGTTYVDVEAASVGHDICADEPWVNGRQSTGEAQVYHPFAVEQRAVADLVLDALDD